MAFGSADGCVVIDTQLNNKGFIKGVKGLEGQLGGLRSVVGKLGTVISAAFAVRTLVNFGRECVELGSNVSEVQNVVDTAFGDMAYKVEAFADGAIRNFGMSRLAAKKTASTYMAMAKGMGVADDAASDMSITLAGLTGDVASFYNISQELADIKLKSVFTGETETLKDLGVVMTQDNLKAYALSQGITKSYEAMSQAEQVALRYNFVLDSLALANGDFARTSNSWANQTRILSMQWQEFMSIIGQALITILTPCVKVLNNIVSGLISIANAFNAAVTAIFGGANTQVKQTAESAAGVSNAIGGAVENQDALTDATKETAKAQEKFLAGFDEITKVTESSGGAASGGTGAAIGSAAGNTYTTEVVGGADQGTAAIDKIKQKLQGLRDSFNDIFGDTKREFGELFDMYADAWADIKSLGSPLKDWIKTDLGGHLKTWGKAANTILSGMLDSFTMVFGDIWDIAIFPLLEKFVTDGIPFLADVADEWALTLETGFRNVKNIFDMVWTDAFAPVLSLLTGFILDIWASVQTAWNEHGAPIFEQFRLALDNTGTLIETIWKTRFKPIVDTALQVLGELWDGHLKPLLDKILEFASAVVEGGLRIYNEAIVPLVTALSETLGPIFGEICTFIIEKFGSAAGFLVDRVGNIIDAFTGIINFLTGVFTGDWDLAWAGLQQTFEAVWDAISALPRAVWDSIKEWWNNNVAEYLTLEYWQEKFGNIAEALETKAKDGVNAAITIFNKFIDWVNDKLCLSWGDFSIAGKKIITGSSFQLLTLPHIPMLAQGAVIPPNREFLAVLGDQKSGTNIETPLSTMKQAFLEAMQESGGGSGGTFKFEIYLNGRKMAVEMVKEVNSMTRAAGKPVLLF